MREVQADRRSMFVRFSEKPLVNRVKRRIDIRMVKFWRSTYEVEISSRSGVPIGGSMAHFIITGGE